MTKPATPPVFPRLRRLRQQAYQLSSRGNDAFFELLDAVLQTPPACSFAKLSLAPKRRKKVIPLSTSASRQPEIYAINHPVTAQLRFLLYLKSNSNRNCRESAVNWLEDSGWPV